LQGDRNRFIFEADTKDRSLQQAVLPEGAEKRLRPIAVRKGVVDLATDFIRSRSGFVRPQDVAKNPEDAPCFAAGRPAVPLAFRDSAAKARF
jgi:hypothetical protein